MGKQVEFYFDFGSPYSYLAYKALPGIAAAHGAQIVWRPMLLGGVFKATGNHSPAEVPANKFFVNINGDIYNVFNSSPIIQYNAAFASWLTPQRIMDGRLYKLSAGISF